MIDRKWYSLYNKPVKNIKTALIDNIKDGDVVHVGTDSQRRDRVESFVTVICCLTPGKGGRAFYTRINEPKYNSLRQKLVQEAWNSVQTALEIEPLLPPNCSIEIHLDANPDAKFKSSSYVKELVGMVVGQGFKYHVKPESWAASHVSEHIVKGRNTKAHIAQR